MTIRWIGCSPSNFKVGRDGITPNLIVLHWMAGRLAATDATFQDGRRQASAHYGIEDSTIHQYVKEEDTSFNCGVWEANLRSISIEHSGGPDLPISNETYVTSIELITDICRRHNISPDNIKKHSDFKATQCPGTLDVNRIIEGVRANLAQPIDPDKVKVDIGGNWGTMEIQAIRSKLNDMQRDVTSCNEKVKQLEGFISKWVEEWKLPPGSNLVEIENEMSKLMLLEDRIQEYRNSIEMCVGAFSTDEALLTAHKGVQKEIELLTKEREDLIVKLNESKAPKGYKFVKTWDIYNLKFKLYKRGGVS